jgi:hypothetical protein
MSDIDASFAFAAAIVVSGSYAMIAFCLWLRRSDPSHGGRVHRSKASNTPPERDPSP